MTGSWLNLPTRPILLDYERYYGIASIGLPPLCMLRLLEISDREHFVMCDVFCIR